MIRLKQFMAPGDLSVRFDIDLSDTGPDDGLETAVLLSLFTDRRAEADDVTDDEERQGWWADALDDDRIGSRLWLLRRTATRPNVAQRAREYAEEALEWLIEDGVAERVSVEAARVGQMLALTVRIERGNGGIWERLWEIRLGV